MNPMELRHLLRRLWQDHIALTRMFILAKLANAPGTQATLNRLLGNQDDIGRALGSVLGPAAGAEAARLLRQHIELAGKVVVEAASNKPLDTLPALRANASQIANTLASVNPRWNGATLGQGLQMHLDQLLEEAKAEIAGDTATGLLWYDRSVDHILRLADFLTDGLGPQSYGQGYAQRYGY